MYTKQNRFIENLSPSLKTLIIDVAKEIKPIIEDIHRKPPMSQNYYQEYYNFLAGFGNDKYKIISLSMYYLGVNPAGMKNALKLF
jgi:hypothetical protein